MSYPANWLSNLRERIAQPHYSFEQDMFALQFRPAAVLILFWDEGGDPVTVVTERASTMPTHAGEVSFPGGGLQAGETKAEGALREANEEVGLVSSSVEILGQLDDAWSGAGFALAPIVGLVSERPEFICNHEVEKTVVINLNTEAELRERTLTKFGHEITEPLIHAHGTDVVGLTADLLFEALEALKGEQSDRGPRRHKYFSQFAKPPKPRASRA